MNTKQDRTQEEAVRRLNREKANRPKDATPVAADTADEMQLSFDGTYLYIFWHGDHYRLGGGSATAVWEQVT